MSQAASLRIRQLLGQALGYLRHEHFAPAEDMLRQAVALDKNHCDALHLFGQMRRVQKRFAEAEEFYRRALVVEPDRAELLYHLGQLLALMGRTDEAVESLRAAVRVKPGFAEAHLELGLALAGMDQFVDAEAAYRRALRLQPNLLAAKQSLSAVLINLRRPQEAEAIARSALVQARTNPHTYAAIEHNLAIALSEQGRHDESLALFEHVQSIVPSLPRVNYNRANTLQSMGRLDDAESAYRQALAQDPLDIKAHTSLNQLLYRLDRADFLESYDGAMKAYPQNPVLPAEKARFLYMADRYEEAREYYSKALLVAPNDFAASNGLAGALARLNEFDPAADIFARLAERRPADVQIRCNYADCLLRMGEWARAQAQAEAALKHEPHHQLALAHWGSALRGLDDAKEHALNDYESFVQIVMLEPPPGFSRMEEFNAALEPYLTGLHLDAREHINQTSRLGTKTLGTLFGAGHDLVERLKLRIDEAVAAYIARMKDDPAHPLFGRRRKNFVYWGSWSTRLKDCGYHVSHVHPQGWISSAYYVAVPDAVEDAETQQGWLKFGEAPFDFGRPGAVRRAVKPVPGQLVLFPSYMWHGTNPFHSAQTRTTIAFDAIPSTG